MGRRGVIVLIDPIHPYAVQFLEAAERRGLGTVCLWSTADAQTGEWKFPALRSAAVVAHHRVALDEAGLQKAAELLRAQHDVVAVVPHAEPWVVPCVSLAALLGLSWAQPGVMPLFRDKYALKRALAAVPGGPRINKVAHVADVADVRRAMDELDLDRVVLKPNNGYGNVSVGFYDRETPDETIALHLARHDQPMLLEERLVGTEYFVNGQVYDDGDLDLTRVGTYLRTTLNGRPNVEVGDHTVRTHEEEFALVADYARHVVQASGVRRTPFHLECIVDEQGPCLLEVGARLVGGDSTIDSWLHGTDVVDAALEQYLAAGSSERLDLDWERYDAQVVGQVQGISHRGGRISAVRGTAAAEATPGFLRWDPPPAVGNKVVPTVDLFGSCWGITAFAPDRESWRELARTLQSTVELDVVGPGDGRHLDRARALRAVALRRLKGRWARAARR